MDYEIEQVPEGTYAVIRRTVAFSDVPKVMPELMGKVQHWADSVPHGLHMCISSTTPEGQLNIAPGVEVEPGAVEPPEDFDLVTRPAQRAAVHLYVGPYEALPGVYQELYDQLQRDGYDGERRADRALRETRSGAGDPDHLARELRALRPHSRTECELRRHRGTSEPDSAQPNQIHEFRAENSNSGIWFASRIRFRESGRHAGVDLRLARASCRLEQVPKLLWRCSR